MYLWSLRSGRKKSEAVKDVGDRECCSSIQNIRFISKEGNIRIRASGDRYLPLTVP